MEWDKLKHIKRFTSLVDVFSEFGQPQFRLGNACSYYLGEGFVISFSETKFRVSGSERFDFGDKGEYALSVYYFLNRSELESEFRIKSGAYAFEGDILGKEFKVFDDVNIGDTFLNITGSLRPKSSYTYYNEGETRKMSNGLFIFSHNWVNYEDYTLKFYGKSKKTKLTAFEYQLSAE